MKKIAVIGATGLLGAPVTRELVKAGYNLTLLVRNPDKARTKFGNKIKLVKGDIQNLCDVKTALAGQEGLYLNLSVTPDSMEKEFQPERDGLKTIIAAAKETGIRRIGYLSSLVHRYGEMDGFQWWVFDIKKEAVQAIRGSGIPYTIFYPSTFMDMFEQSGYRQGKRLMLAGASRQGMYLIAASDYSRQVAKAFENNGPGNKEYAIQGPEAFTADEAAKVFQKNYKKQRLLIAKAPLGLLKALGLFSKKMAYGAKIIEALNNYPEKFEAGTTWQELGKPALGFVDYIKRL